MTLQLKIKPMTTRCHKSDFKDNFEVEKKLSIIEGGIHSRSKFVRRKIERSWARKHYHQVVA
jgi:hypothetical protein